MPSIETAVMVAIGGLILLFGWSQWSTNLQPGVEEQVGKMQEVIGKGKTKGKTAPGGNP